MKAKIKLDCQEDTISLGKIIGKLVKAHSLITLSGDLGAGKTTLTKGIGQGLGIKRVINSPTFTILKQYQGRLKLSHFDVYRLEGQDDELGFEEIFDSDDVCVVEWSQFIENILPHERLEIILNHEENGRTCIMHPIGQRYEELVKEIINENNCNGYIE